MMSYKYKDEILADIGPEPNCNYDFEKEEYYKKIDELNHVYAQAAKAEIYEKLPGDILQTMRALQAEMPRTKDHLMAIGTYQTILNHLKSYGLEVKSDEL